MNIDFKKIFTAWTISINPNQRQRDLAEKRWEICKTCPSKVEIIHDQEWTFTCKDCGCPLKKKIFTDEFDSCPNNFWVEVEKDYFEIKKEKTLI
jgi:hypothetical protein